MPAVGGSLFLIALGAILTWVMTDSALGVVLIVIGAVCLIISGLRMTTRRGTGVVQQGVGGYRAHHAYRPPGRRFLNRR